MLNFIKTYFKGENSPYLAITSSLSDRFNILMHSEGSDISRVYMYYLMHYILTNKNKKVVVASTIYENCLTLMTDFVYHFKKINRFFPDIEMSDFNKEIRFSNGCEIKFYKVHKYSNLDADVDFVIFMDMAFGRPIQIEVFYKLAVVVLLSKPDSKFMINSIPNGNNMFYEIFRQAEQSKNMFKATRVYFWQDPEKSNSKWVTNMINTIGEKEFSAKYNLYVNTKKNINCV